MLKEYQQQLMDEKEKARELGRLERELAMLTDEQKQLAQKEARLRQQLEEEKVDVEKLEGFSLAGIFATITGSKDEKLLEEKQEVAAAQLKWKDAKDARQELDNELVDLQQRIRKLGNPNETYQQLLMQKQHYLVTNNHEDGERAYQLLEELADLKADIKEMEEALQAGKSASYALHAALESLGKAKNWGTMDMFGGGVISTSIKHSNLDDAKQEVHRAQALLRKFAHELNDIGQTFHVELSISGGLTFMDYFFDGLISDWLVQDKIHDSINQVEDMYNQTKQTLTQLEQLRSEADATKESVETSWKQLVESAGY